MDNIIRDAVWKQVGASIDTLEKAIKFCPDDVWSDGFEFQQFWYITYHTLFWLDFYVSDSIDTFTPPKPFTMSEMDPSGILPERVYEKNELLAYLEYGRNKCKNYIENLSEDKAAQQFKFGRVNISYAELILYVMRHVQHHAAQLNLLLRQKTNSSPGWVFQAKE